MRNRPAVLCLEGPAARVDEKILISIQRHVVVPLNATPIGFWPYKKREHYERALSFAERFGWKAILEKDVATSYLVQWLYNVSVVSGYLAEVSNWIRRSARVLRGTRQVVNFFAKEKCWHLLRAEETVSAQKFSWWIYSRVDLLWLGTHPPLMLLLDTAVWVPDSSDWAGVNDRHAVIPREHVDAYFRRYTRLLDMLAGIARNKESDAAIVIDIPSPEIVLHESLVQNRVAVMRFAPLAAVVCCRTKEQCSHHGWECPHGFRNGEEYNDAKEVSRRQTLGWEWSWCMRSLFPPCYGPNRVAWREACCSAGSGLWKIGNLGRDCFENPFYSQHRCCGDGLMLGLVPSRERLLYDSTKLKNEERALTVHEQKSATSATRLSDLDAMPSNCWNLGVDHGVLDLRQTVMSCFKAVVLPAAPSIPNARYDSFTHKARMPSKNNHYPDDNPVFF